MELLVSALAFASVVVCQTAAVIAARNLSSHDDFDGGHRVRGGGNPRCTIDVAGKSRDLRQLAVIASHFATSQKFARCEVTSLYA